MSFEFNANQFTSDLQKQLGDNLERAAIHLTNKVKEALNRSQPRSRSVGEKGVWYKGEDPSQPGESPKKITGYLQRSIAHDMSADRQQAFVGSNLPAALYLELGTSKMQARPFLRSTLDREADAIAKIIGGQA